MRTTFSHNLRETMKGIADDLPRAVTAAADQISDGLKNDLRQTVTTAGLGSRLANTWRGTRYPQNRPSLSAAAYVWSKAPDIVDAFDRGATILPVGGSRYLAIPTANVPPRSRGGGFGGKGSRMNPFEVETAFNQDLKFAKSKKGTLIAFIVPQRGGKRVRRGLGANSKITVMFILVPAAHMPKKFDIDTVANRWADRTQGILDDAMAAKDL